MVDTMWSWLDIENEDINRKISRGRRKIFRVN